VAPRRCVARCGADASVPEVGVRTPRSAADAWRCERKVQMTVIQPSEALAGRQGPTGTSCAALSRPPADFTVGGIRLFWD